MHVKALLCVNYGCRKKVLPYREAINVDPRQKVERCIDSFRHSASELRTAALETENSQARNAFIASAQKVEECIEQCQIAVNQLK